MATKNFRQECLLGEGGFGRVFKGNLQSNGQIVAVKQLDRNGMQGNKEFLVEVMMLSLLQHPNLISLIGYCADGDQRLLVYEYLCSAFWISPFSLQLLSSNVSSVGCHDGDLLVFLGLHEQAQPIFRDPKKFLDLADPRMVNEFPVTSLNQAVGICAMCLQEEPSVRPLIGDVVAALSFLSVPQPNTTPSHSVNDTSSNHDDSSSEESDHEGSNRGSVSEQKNKDSSSMSASESFGKAEDQPSVGNESEPLSERHSSVDSDDEHTYSDSGSEGESGNFGDAENTEFENSGRSVEPSEGNFSSDHGSSRRSSPTKRTGSRRRKLVVTFKEPSLSSIRNANSKKANHDKKCSGSESSSSESEDEQSSPRHQKKAQRRKASKHIYGDEHRVFDGRQKDGPKLRHTQTR